MGTYCHDVKVWINPRPSCDDIELGWVGIGADGKRYAPVLQYADEPVFPGCMVGSLTRLDREQARSLMDMLWGAGVRPSVVVAPTHQPTAGEGHIRALEQHIADLRRIAFGHQEVTSDPTSQIDIAKLLGKEFSERVQVEPGSF